MKGLILLLTLLMPTQACVAFAQDTSSTAGDEDAPVPVPQATEKAISYHRSGHILWSIDILWGFLVPAFFLFSGLSARIRGWALKLGKRWFIVVGIYFATYSIATFLIDLPLEYYEGYVRQHEYGLSNQTFQKWLSDSLTSLAVGVIAGVLFLWIPYLLLKKSPRRWWLHTSILSVPFMIFAMLISPIWIDPLFNDFGPMKDKALEMKILELADRAGIEGGRVFEVNKSVDTGAVNAYVSGFGSTKRIVLWDTIIAKLDQKELLFVMGHEMGHYVLGHIWKSIILGSFLILGALYAASRLAVALVARYKHCWGFDQLHDVASLPLMLILVSFFSLLLSPAVNGYSRYQERECDRFGLEITRANRSAATAFVKLQVENLAVPRPGWFYKFWRASHPPTGERIDFCNGYRPWKTGRPLKYAHLFREAAGDKP